LAVLLAQLELTYCSLGDPRTSRRLRPHKRFYEKVIKVKADVAALRNFFSDGSIDVRW